MTELDKLESYLKEHEYEYYRHELPGYAGEQIVVAKNGKHWFDVVCHNFSYGHQQGLLEAYKLDDHKDVTGWLTAKDVIKKMRDKTWRD